MFKTVFWDMVTPVAFAPLLAFVIVGAYILGSLQSSDGSNSQEPATSDVRPLPPVLPPCDTMGEFGYWRVEIVKEGFHQTASCDGQVQTTLGNAAQTPTPQPMNGK